jgi:hypothetical protein
MNAMFSLACGVEVSWGGFGWSGRAGGGRVRMVLASIAMRYVDGLLLEGDLLTMVNLP